MASGARYRPGHTVALGACLKGTIRLPDLCHRGLPRAHHPFHASAFGRRDPHLHAQAWGLSGHGGVREAAPPPIQGL